MLDRGEDPAEDPGVARVLAEGGDRAAALRALIELSELFRTFPRPELGEERADGLARALERRLDEALPPFGGDVLAAPAPAGVEAEGAARAPSRLESGRRRPASWTRWAAAAAALMGLVGAMGLWEAGGDEPLRSGPAVGADVEEPGAEANAERASAKPVEDRKGGGSNVSARAGEGQRSPAPSSGGVVPGIDGLEPALRRLDSDVRRCLPRGAVAEVEMTLDGRHGQVTRARAVGPLEDTPEGECVERVARRLAVPPFGASVHRFTHRWAAPAGVAPP
jgi:hypothetical protein